MTVGRIISFSILALIFFIAWHWFPHRWDWFWGGFDSKEQTLSPSVVAAALASFIAFIALKVNAGINMRNKRTDVIVGCNSRYHDLYQPRHELMETQDKVKEKREKISKKDWGKDKDIALYDQRLKSYLKRYWGLKSDQFDYWLAGYVDQETFASWVLSTADALTAKDPTAIDYMIGLAEMEIPHAVVNQRFVNLIEFLAVHACCIKDRGLRYAAVLQYLRAVEKLEKKLIRQLSHNDFTRVWMTDFAHTLKPVYLDEYTYLVDEPFYIDLKSRVWNIWSTGLLDGFYYKAAETSLDQLTENITRWYGPEVEQQTAVARERAAKLEKAGVPLPKFYYDLHKRKRPEPLVPRRLRTPPLASGTRDIA